MNDSYRELLLGCGHKKDKRVIPSGVREWRNVTTVDINPACDPDVIADLDAYDWPAPGRKYATWQREPNVNAPFAWLDGSYDEIHAYEVMEHLGTQGDFRVFFYFMSRIWRLLKPDGMFCATTPSRYSPWLWGDPGHRRAILPQTLIFLDRTEYRRQLGHTAMSDYRAWFDGDFRIHHSADDRTTHSFILQAMKPVRE